MLLLTSLPHRHEPTAGRGRRRNGMMNFGQNPYRGPHDDYGLSFYFHRGVHVRHRKLYFQTEKGSIADVDHASEGTEALGI